MEKTTYDLLVTDEINTCRMMCEVDDRKVLVLLVSSKKVKGDGTREVTYQSSFSSGLKVGDGLGYIQALKAELARVTAQHEKGTYE